MSRSEWSTETRFTVRRGLSRWHRLDISSRVCDYFLSWSRMSFCKKEIKFFKFSKAAILRSTKFGVFRRNQSRNSSQLFIRFLQQLQWTIIENTFLHLSWVFYQLLMEPGGGIATELGCGLISYHIVCSSCTC